MAIHLRPTRSQLLIHIEFRLFWVEVLDKLNDFLFKKECQFRWSTDCQMFHDKLLPHKLSYKNKIYPYILGLLSNKSYEYNWQVK